MYTWAYVGIYLQLIFNGEKNSLGKTTNYPNQMVRETSPRRDGIYKYSKNSDGPSQSFIHRSLRVVMYSNISWYRDKVSISNKVLLIFRKILRRDHSYWLKNRRSRSVFPNLKLQTDQCLLFTIMNFLWLGILWLGLLCVRNLVR